MKNKIGVRRSRHKKIRSLHLIASKTVLKGEIKLVRMNRHEQKIKTRMKWNVHRSVQVEMRSSMINMNIQSLRLIRTRSREGTHKNFHYTKRGNMYRHKTSRGCMHRPKKNKTPISERLSYPKENELWSIIMTLAYAQIFYENLSEWHIHLYM